MFSGSGGSPQLKMEFNTYYKHYVTQMQSGASGLLKGSFFYAIFKIHQEEKPAHRNKRERHRCTAGQGSKGPVGAEPLIAQRPP